MPRSTHLREGKKIVGVVVSSSMDATITVAVQRFYLHPRTSKVMRHVSKFFCHDHHELCSVGDRVHIQHWGPISRKKSYTVVDIVQRHPQLESETFPMSKLLRPPEVHAAAQPQQREQQLA